MSCVGSQTHYETLGVPASASFKEIRKNYLRLALLEHPDKGGSKERFQALIIAFEMLSSARARLRYDKQLERSGRLNRRSKTQACTGFQKCDDIAKQGSKAKASNVNSDIEMRDPMLSHHDVTKDSTTCKTGSHEGVAREDFDHIASTPFDIALQRLEAALRHLDTIRRKQSLKSMPFRVRSRLLLFMEKQRSKMCSATSQRDLSSSIVVACASESCSRASSFSTEESETDGLEVVALADGADDDNVDDAEELLTIDSTRDVHYELLFAGRLDDAPRKNSEDAGFALVFSPQENTTVCLRGSSEECHNKRSSNIRGVLSTSSARSRFPSYCAVVDICHLLVQTRSVSLELALQYHAVLIQAKQTVLDGGHSEDLGKKLPAAIAAACLENDIMQDDMGLAYGPILCAWAWLKSNIHGKFSIDLSESLAQRECLLRAKRQGWQELRQEWIRLMTTKISSRRSRLGHRINPKTIEEATRVVDAAWARSAKHREDMKSRLDRRLAARQFKQQELADRRERADARRGRAEERRRLHAERRAARAAYAEMRRETRELSASRKKSLEQLKVDRAVAAVERLVEREMRDARRASKLRLMKARRAASAQRNAAKYEARARKRSRDIHWQWMNDPARTLDEIMGIYYS